jgi:hypothetical protein
MRMSLRSELVPHAAPNAGDWKVRSPLILSAARLPLLEQKPTRPVRRSLGECGPPARTRGYELLSSVASAKEDGRFCVRRAWA